MNPQKKTAEVKFLDGFRGTLYLLTGLRITSRFSATELNQGRLGVSYLTSF